MPPEVPPLPWLRWRWAAPIAAVFLLPFLFVAIPPLVDVPGSVTIVLSDSSSVTYSRTGPPSGGALRM